MIRILRFHVPAAMLALALTATTALPGIGHASPGTASRTTALGCPASAKPFKPTRATIPVLNRSYGVVPVRRTADGNIGAPPLTTRGKTLVGWDRMVKPGSRRGTVVLDAHTWPDGSALGNAMLQRLKKGARIRLTNGTHAVCYRIVSRKSYPRDRIPVRKLFVQTGKPRVVIVVCSGKRLGPGNWLRRTVWIGEPIQ